MKDFMPLISDKSDNPNASEQNFLLSLEQLSFQLTLSEATSLARKGKYIEAESLISTLGSTQEHPLVLDLRARIYAQQGKLKEAEEFWRRALLKEPNNNRYLSGIAYIHELQRGSFSRLRLVQERLIHFIVSLFIIVLITYSVLSLPALGSLKLEASLATSENNRSTPESTQFAWDDNGKILKKQEELITKLSRLENLNENVLNEIKYISMHQDVVTNLLLSTPQPLDINIDGVNGILTIPEGEKINVIFQEGLFLFNTALSSEGANQLYILGRSLEPYREKITIQIRGYTDGTERDDYFDLSLLRAVRVFEYLTSKTYLPEEIFTIKPQAGAPPPYPSDSLQNKKRNRTVVITITRR